MLTTLRTQQCDEARPRCTKCEAYGVICNYQNTVPDLQLASEQRSQWGVFRVSEPQRTTSARRNPQPPAPASAYSPPIYPPLSVPLVSADETTCVELNLLVVDFLNRFWAHNAAPELAGPAVKRAFEEQITRLAFQVSCFMVSLRASGC